MGRGGEGRKGSGKKEWRKGLRWGRESREESLKENEGMEISVEGKMEWTSCMGVQLTF